jgi:SAM-dependent methyltransferase
MSHDDDQRSYWNERYREQGELWGAQANRFVAAELNGLSRRRILDVACGQGRNAVWLALQGHQVTAVDISDVAVEQGRAIAAEAGVDVEFLTRDLLDWEPEPGGYDLVLLAYVQLPEDARVAVHAKAIAALAPGGRIFLIAHHRDNLEHGIGGPPTTDALFDEAQLEEDFADLSIVRNEVVLRPAEKDGVSGNAIDILFIAERPAA